VDTVPSSHIIDVAPTLTDVGRDFYAHTRAWPGAPTSTRSTKDTPVNKVKGDVTRLVRGIETRPWAHQEAGYWHVQVDHHPVLGYVMRVPAELGDPFTYEVYANARNKRGERIWAHREAQERPI
jgi:hypothetical protein